MFRQFMMVFCKLILGLTLVTAFMPSPSRRTMSRSTKIMATTTTNKMVSTVSDDARRNLIKNAAALVVAPAIWLGQPQVALSYEARVIGDENPSPTIAAFNIQIEQTTARLAKDGFPLDSREDEAKRLSEALSSFSYDSSSGSSKSASTKQNPTQQNNQVKTNEKYDF